MQTVNILSLIRLTAEDLIKIQAVDPAIRLSDAAGWFDGEYRETWPAFTAGRYLTPDTTGRGTRDERDQMLARADIVIGGFPFPLDLRTRSPRLKWFHQRPAGASNLLRSDLWKSDVVVTTSRGSANGLAIAEYAVAGIMHIAKGLNRAAVDRNAGTFGARMYRPWLLAGKTVCVVGAGGIGQEVGRLCAALGMRVLGTRRHAMAEPPSGFQEVGGAADLDRYLPDSDVVVICCQWTPETDQLLNKDRFAAMKAGGILVNVARGEIVDEEALVGALANDHLRGAALDVYVGEFEHTPDARLWSDPRVLITPHISGASDLDRHGGIELFCENLRAWLDGRPMRNVIDWERGYEHIAGRKRRGRACDLQIRRAAALASGLVSCHWLFEWMSGQGFLSRRKNEDHGGPRRRTLQDQRQITPMSLVANTLLAKPIMRSVDAVAAHSISMFDCMIHTLLAFLPD